MTLIREDLVYASIDRAYALIDHNIQDTLEEQHEFSRRTVLADKSLTKKEKSYAVKLLNIDFDGFKIRDNQGTKRICEDCYEKCLATLYCEYCIRDYLENEFLHWTSGNNDVDDLIQQCQMEALRADRVVEWIPFNKLENIKFLTKGGCSEIYTANWIDGRYDEWDSIESQLKRYGEHEVVLKKLNNIESANRSWIEESKSHLFISNKYGLVVQSYGLTKHPSEGYMLVMNKFDTNLKEYLRQNYKKLTWEKRIQIIDDIVYSISRIHKEDAIHRDLHPGNILLNRTNICISDFGFCGPADKPLNSTYGNLPYIAPEVIYGRETTKASDVYSIGMLMWEISSGQSPFSNYENDYDLAQRIINGMRPKIIPETPLECKKLMEQCWDADPTKRPDIDTLRKEIREINRLNYQNTPHGPNKNKSLVKKLFEKIKLSKSKEQKISIIITEADKTSSFETSYYTSTSRLFTSKVYQFENLPEPRNATEEDQEAFHSRTYSFNIPDNIDEFNNRNDNNTLRLSNIVKDDNNKLSVPKNKQISSNNFNKFNNRNDNNTLGLSNIVKDDNNKLSVPKNKQISSNSDDSNKLSVPKNKQINSNNVDEFNNRNDNNTLGLSNIVKVPKIKQISSNNDIQRKETIPPIKKCSVDDVDDKDEIYNNPNFHPEEQDELELPDDIIM